MIKLIVDIALKSLRIIIEEIRERVVKWRQPIYRITWFSLIKNTKQTRLST